MARYVGTRGDDVLIVGVSTPAAASAPAEKSEAGSGQAPSTNTVETVAFSGALGDYRSTLGMYEIDSNGQISNVRLVFENATSPGAPSAPVDLTVSAGSTVVYFILPDGYRYNSGLFDWVRQDGIASHYELRNGDGSTSGNGNVNAGPLTLVWVDDKDGWSEKLRGAYDFATFHSLDGSESGLNPDGTVHVHVTVNADGSHDISFEDQWNGGDQSFTDLTIHVSSATTPADGTDTGAGQESAQMIGGPGHDLLTGGSGGDTIQAGLGNDVVHGGAGDDVLNGGAGSDVLAGGPGNDTIYGGAGDDTILAAGGGHDAIYGGKGIDTLSFEGVDADVTASLRSGTASYTDGGVQATFMLRTIEALIGGNGNDRLLGSNDADVIAGGAGNDTIDGGRGSDILTGGAGADVFQFARTDVADGSVDHITDFTVGVDRLDFSQLLSANVFNTGKTAKYVQVQETGGDTLVQAKIGDHWVDVAVLDNIHIDSILHLGL